ncbi:MAG: hypothetical protein AAF602_28295, partial [Myxococcota bacterium]
MVKLLGCMVAWAFATPAWAGVVFEVEVKDHSGTKPTTEAMQAVVEGRRLKMASSKAPDRALMAFDGTKRQMTLFDHDARTYTVLDEAVLKQTMQGVSSAIEGAMSEAMDELSPAERAQFEALMKNNPALAGRLPGMAAPPTAKPQRELRRVGTRATHGGYACVRYDLLEDGVRTQELWVTDWSNLKGMGEVRAVFEDLTSFFAGIVEALPSTGPMSGALPMDDELAMMKDLRGFPVFAREFAPDGSLESETTLRSSKTQAVPSSAFGPPAGYRRQEMSKMMP